MSWKYKMIQCDKNLNMISFKKYSCGGCSKKRVRSSDIPYRLEDRHGKVVWKNNAYQELEK